MHSYEKVFTRLYCKFIVLENNIIEFLPYFQENLNKGGFDLGEAFQFIYDKLTEYSGEAWSPTEIEFKNEIDANGIYTQLSIVNNPISLLQHVVKIIIQWFANLNLVMLINDIMMMQKSLL